MLVNRSQGTEIEHPLRTVYRSGESLLRIVNDILDFSRFESESFKLEPGNFNLRDLVQDIYELLGPIAKQKEIGFEVEVHPDVPSLFWADAGRLAQVLRNLIGNALKFTTQGRVKLMVECGAKVQDETVQLCIRIIDSGIGVPIDKRDQLFTPFFQAHNGAANSPGTVPVGTGLGLSISRKLVQKMGGEIVYKPLERGSEFTVLVPMQKSPSTAESMAIEQKAEALATTDFNVFGLQADLPLLVVDDNTANQTLIEMQLQQLGLRCHMVSDGVAALEAFRENSYSAILMDCQMPTMDGFEATRLIRNCETVVTADKPRAPTPILALTANITPADRAKCHQSGMNAVLAKPLRLEDLYKSLLSIGFKNSQGVIKLLDTKRLLENLGSSAPALVPKLLNAFVTSLGKAEAEITKGPLDRELVLFWAHYLQGPAGSLGAEMLADRSRQFETDLRSGTDINLDIETVKRELLKEIQRTKVEVLATLQKWGNGLDLLE